MTRNLIYSMGVSLDGFIAGPDGDIGWTAPDDELHGFHNDRVRELGAQLLGRRLYEEMLFWETAHEDPAAADVVVEFARIWQALPKIVFSTTLERVEGRATLAQGGIADEVARLKAQPGGDIGVGGAGLAASCIALGLVDQFDLFVYPVVIGAGTPLFPPGAPRMELELIETRTFASRVVYARYRLG